MLTGCLTLLLATVSSVAVAPTVFALPGADASPNHHSAAESVYKEIWSTTTRPLSTEGYFFHSHGPVGAVATLLVESPSGRRVVIENRLAVQNGWRQTTLVDDATGWRFTITRHYDFRAPNLDQFFKDGYDWFVPGKGRVIKVAAAVNGRQFFEAEMPVEAQSSTMHAAFVDLLRKKGLAESLEQEVPAGLNEAIAFLDAALQTANLRSVVNVLAGIAPQEIGKWGYRGLGWTQDEKFVQLGVTVSSPEILDFTSQFTSLDPAHPQGTDPLASLAAATPDGSTEAISE